MANIRWWSERGQWVVDVSNPESHKRERWYLGADERAIDRQKDQQYDQHQSQPHHHTPESVHQISFAAVTNKS